MGIWDIGAAFFNAIGFSAWGIIGRFSGATGPWIGVSIIISTAIPVIAFSWNKLSGTMPDAKAMACLIIAGLVNGVAFQVNSNKMSDDNVVAGAFLVMVYVLMAVITPLLDWIFNNSIPNKDHWIGFALAFGAIFFLSK